MICEQIEVKFRVVFDLMYFEVVDESYCYNVFVGFESYFKVVLVSDCFIGECFFNCYCMIYGMLIEELLNMVYVLVLYIYMIKEWEVLQDMVFVLLLCCGVGSIVQKFYL